MREIAPGVAVVPTLIANAYLVGDRASWVLVDACAPGHERLIQRAAERRFGRGSRPSAILLTHGHFDHAGSAATLADAWNVPIYAHALELPLRPGGSLYTKIGDVFAWTCLILTGLALILARRRR